MELERTEEINKDIQELYKTVSDKIALSVASGNFTVESFEVILAKIVETIEELDRNKALSLTGTEKRTIGVNVVRLVLEDLHKHGKLTDELYSALNSSLTYVAPLLFYAAKQAWKKIQEIDADIEKNGCKGCFTRNFRKK
jgi:hypothetical protein